MSETTTATPVFNKCLLKSKAPGNKTFQFQSGAGVTRARVKATPFTFKTEAEFVSFMAEIRTDNPGWEFTTVDLSA